MDAYDRSRDSEPSRLTPEQEAAFTRIRAIMAECPEDRMQRLIEYLEDEKNEDGPSRPR